MRHLLLTLVLALTACEGGGSGGGAAATSPVVSTRTVHVFGDEMTAGSGITTSYGKIIADSLKLTLVNHGRAQSVIGAATTVNNVLGVYGNSELNQVKVNDIVVVMVGYQDVRWYGNPPAANFTNEYAPFIQKAYNAGADVFIVSPPKMKASSYALFSPYNMGSDAAMTTYANMLHNYANTYNSSRVVFVDVTAVFNPIAANLQADSQYPNEVGQLIIANEILNNIH